MNLILNDPKYKLGEKVNITSMGIPLTVVITERTFECNIDTGKQSFYYSLEHNMPKGWTWGDISEDDLEQWIRNSEKDFKTK